MIDVNIIAKGNTARLIELECGRLGLGCEISELPLSDSRLYICDLEVTDARGLPADKTLVIGNTEGFSHSLTSTFLLTDLRKKLVEMLTNSAPQEKTVPPKRTKKSPSLTLLESTKSAKLRGGDVSLSPTEFKILSLLLDRKGDVVTHSEIDALIDGGNSNKANVYICFLRKKLEADGEKIIYSVRGKGFMIK